MISKCLITYANPSIETMHCKVSISMKLFAKRISNVLSSFDICALPSYVGTSMCARVIFSQHILS